MGIIGIFTLETVKTYSNDHPEMWIIAMVLMFVSLITCAEGFMLGTVTSTYDANEVLLAVGVTAAIGLALTIFAFQTKIDFTAMGGILLAVLLCFVLFGLIAAFFPQSRTVNLVYAAIGCIIFSIYIIYDTQLMVGGSHKYSLSPEEHVFASLNLYLDIVNLFMYILSIIGNSRN